MPIGFDSGGAGAEPPPATPIGDGTDPISWPDVEAVPLIPVVWTRWQTAEDERVCPECGPLDGLVWEEGDGPSPPLHGNCRCSRVFAFTEYRTST
jgi:hypothetical protein